jgi:hypothetical protein
MKWRGKQVVEQLARGAVRDDTKRNLRHIVKNGGEEEMRRDFSDVARGADKIRAVETPRGVVQTAEYADGTTASARGFSTDGRPSIQINDPNSNEIVKVRYEQ